ncbi:MAG: hypothetical protein AUF79_00535 [Crenarchaeota archaeon 13_1_20CM_2_51_8]|nr:MAG: hypothetical protein AUF79_00535 [Crenarchaeota archaeon 13_1_20CM_2_51_8]
MILHPAPATADSYNSLTTHLDTLIFIGKNKGSGQACDFAIPNQQRTTLFFISDGTNFQFAFFNLQFAMLITPLPLTQ